MACCDCKYKSVKKRIFNSFTDIKKFYAAKFYCVAKKQNRINNTNKCVYYVKKENKNEAMASVIDKVTS